MTEIAQANIVEERPIIDQLLSSDDGRQKLALIKSTVAQKASDAQVGMFLELAHRYGLDPFAHEIWCAVSKSGRLLIMVGRDGLRKIAQRSGLHVDCDVVCAEDDLHIVRTPDGNRTIAHSYGKPQERGAIVGAWAEVRRGGPRGEPMGYFYAALGEYRPVRVPDESPWNKQVSVMILAAAERQAIRQATPLGGLLVEGEDESAFTDSTALPLGAGEGTGEAESGDLELPLDVEAVIGRAERAGHVGLSDRSTAAMVVAGQPPTVVEEWVARSHEELTRFEREALTAARAAEQAAREEAEATDADTGDEPAAEAPDISDDERAIIAEMRGRAAALLAQARDAEDEGEAQYAEDLRAQAQAFQAQAEAVGDADQPELPL